MGWTDIKRSRDDSATMMDGVGSFYGEYKKVECARKFAAQLQSKHQEHIAETVCAKHITAIRATYAVLWSTLTS